MQSMLKFWMFAGCLLIFPFSQAAGPTPPPAPPTPAPTLAGVWYLNSRNCTSNAEVKDGFQVGTDTFQITYNEDMTFEEKVVVSGCESMTAGVYSLEEKKVLLNAKSQKTCKDSAAKPVDEHWTTFVAYLDDNESVTVTTGDRAAAVCPAGDAFVQLFSRIILQ